MKKLLFLSILLLAGRVASGQDTTSSCGAMFTSGYLYQSEGEEPQGYDTLKAFMEECPLYQNSAEGFNMIAGAVAQWNAGGNGKWSDFMAWLKKVLYYNPDTEWYCDDVSDMLDAAQSDQTVEVICQYILQSGKCPVLASYFQETLNAAIQDRHTAWLDSLKYAFEVREDSMGQSGVYWWPDSIGEDTLAHPFTDTVVPTLWQDSLEVLLGPQYAGVSSPSPSSSQALLSAQLMENPTETDEIGVSYTMGRTALVTMQLLDVLGKSVPISNAQYLLQSPGTHEATLPVPNLPGGTYYLRLSTDLGDAMTLKLVKE